MPQSFACLNYHIVFSTKDRMPWITPNHQQRLFDYLGGIIRSEKGILLAANGMPDHAHILTSIHRTVAVADAVRVIKAKTSGWMHTTFPELRQFAWQEGYGAFTISHKGVPRVKAYLANQEEHLRTVSFKDEFIAFLQEHEIAYDEQYLWD